MLGDPRPNPSDIVALYKQRNIQRMRLYAPDPEALNALRTSDIELILDVPKTDLERVPSSQAEADTWVQDNVKNYDGVRFRYITVGNEVKPSEPAGSVLFQPSRPCRTSITRFLEQASGSSYKDNMDTIPLEYALFKPTPVVNDDQYSYQNLFDANLDAVYAALEKSGGGSLEIVVSECGWPTEGGPGTSVENAMTYVNNLIQHVKSGTPRKPGKSIETYIFAMYVAMYGENQKGPPELEKFWGMFISTNILEDTSS
ncbi:hypothetical protein DY000_02056486 [Brassica cretica]|uniref:glucan endo-1,3-beta-D-glucosidase n=1 Tax=Brassica cretica TaxID=69181 RepID=A0ABQ7AEG5_BRACR|nr:hypothetical protein DY000_02056486 [Brassica cretica]